METTEIADKLIALLEIFPDTRFREKDLSSSLLFSPSPEIFSEIVAELDLTGFLVREEYEGEFYLSSKEIKKESSKEKNKENINIYFSFIILKLLSIDNNYNNNKEGDPTKSGLTLHSSSSSNKREEPRENPTPAFSNKVDLKKLRESKSTPVPLKASDVMKGKLVVPASIEGIIDFWNNLGLKKCQKKDTRVFRETVLSLKRARRGSLYKEQRVKNPGKLEIEQIKKTIQKFSLPVLSPIYAPKNGTPYHSFLCNMSLGNFILNPRGQSEQSRSYLLFHHIKNLTLVRIEGIDYEEIVDEYPTVTNIFRNFYADKVLGGFLPKNGLKLEDENKFKAASIRTVDFFEENQHRMNLRTIGVFNEPQFAALVCEALESDLKNELHTLSPGYFCTDTTFHRRLPSYLFKQGILKDKDGY